MDLTINCKIQFTEAVFYGTYPKVKFSHNRKIVGKILKDSYGEKTGQHTFTIEVIESDDDSLIGTKILRKGRNIYPTCVILELPNNHKELADDKHERKYQKKYQIQQRKNFF